MITLDPDLPAALEALARYHLHTSRLLTAQKLAGGVSADVYRLEVERADGTHQQVVLRAHGATHGGHGAALEHALLGAAHQAGLLAPRPIALDMSGQHWPDPCLLLDYIDGTIGVPQGEVDAGFRSMAEGLHKVHTASLAGFPALPLRLDPIPELIGFLPDGARWDGLRADLERRGAAPFAGAPVLLHGDYWPGNLVWQGTRLVGLLDWEDAAVGDPLSDVACACLELRYKLGAPAMTAFVKAYEAHRPVDHARLSLWLAYVSAAALRYMGAWGLDATLEAHMRANARATLEEAELALLQR